MFLSVSPVFGSKENRAVVERIAKTEPMETESPSVKRSPINPANSVNPAYF
jgi:hypothetical protein